MVGFPIVCFALDCDFNSICHGSYGLVETGNKVQIIGNLDKHAPLNSYAPVSDVGWVTQIG